MPNGWPLTRRFWAVSNGLVIPCLPTLVGEVWEGYGFMAISDKQYQVATFWVALVLAIVTCVHLVATVLFSLEIVDFRKRLFALEAKTKLQQPLPQKPK